MLKIERAERLKRLPPYLFKEIDRLKEDVRAKGIDIIDLGVGDPDLPTPVHIIEASKKAVSDPANHRYPSYSGMADLNAVVAKWYKQRFNVDLDAGSEVVTLIGSKEGIAHIPLAFINPGDIALVASPGYPVYHIGTEFAGGKPYFMDLLKENKFLPDLEAISPEVAKMAKMMFINYPNNPTAAVATRGFFESVVAFAAEYNVIICHDAAYSEMAFDGYRPMSFLEAEGAKSVGIEFHSLSKTYNMTGWRIGFAVGCADVISALGQVKNNIDSGVFQAIQIAGIAALEGGQACVEDMRQTYAERRDILVAGLRSMGLSVETPRATFYLWVEVPHGYTSAGFASLLLTEAGIVTTPGNGFGTAGEGFVRMALTVDREEIREAVERMIRLGPFTRKAPMEP
ncbi:MAG: LL-diaminopimelate aminotransferase [Desulfobacterales bacterium C00003060]|nr:MAG: LL-diaminopimelate aminotransferase [Desulfobacterales bacterium S3730MH5]OEU79545.1 MAG: LL-diaminopimelate aminotransferase [Desulfobacterales bacterium C00003060]OEU80817.1 MAG: LL-diaminopimelate aminotransferase [Desulfobacterales bacterium S5133MH4]